MLTISLLKFMCFLVSKINYHVWVLKYLGIYTNTLCNIYS